MSWHCAVEPLLLPIHPLCLVCFPHCDACLWRIIQWPAITSCSPDGYTFLNVLLFLCFSIRSTIHCIRGHPRRQHCVASFPGQMGAPVFRFAQQKCNSLVEHWLETCGEDSLWTLLMETDGDQAEIEITHSPS